MEVQSVLVIYFPKCQYTADSKINEKELIDFLYDQSFG